MYEIHSPTIVEIAKALSQVQQESNPQKEALIIKKAYGYFFKCKKRNQHHRCTLEQLFFSKVAFGVSDCWFWVGCRDQTSYGRMRTKNNNCQFSHRISWQMFKGIIPKGMKVLHKCDNPSCVNPEHLFLGTQNDNVQDMIIKGRMSSKKSFPGELNGYSKLKNFQVLEIREIYSKKTLNQYELARKYNVSSMTINRIVNNKLWRHI